MNAKKKDVVLQALQKTLVNLNDLALSAKQAHWNIQGHGFYALHTFLDEVVSEARAYSDEAAERLAGLDGIPDARAQTIAKKSALVQLEAEKLPIGQTWAWLADVLAQAAQEIRDDLDKVDAQDPVTGDLLIGVIKGLELRSWMARMEAV